MSLWDRLGGEKTIRKIVDEFSDWVLKDPTVNYSRNGHYPIDEEMVEKTKVGAFNFLSHAMGGPYSYVGKSLLEIHKNMAITDSEFDAFIAHFRKALELNKIESTLITEVMANVETTRGSVVSEAKRTSVAS